MFDVYSPALGDAFCAGAKADLYNSWKGRGRIWRSETGTTRILSCREEEEDSVRDAQGRELICFTI